MLYKNCTILFFYLVVAIPCNPPTDARDIEIQANEILHHKLTLNGYLAEFTGQPMEQITIDTDRDFFMSAQEATEYGLIDAVISKPALAAL